MSSKPRKSNRLAPPSHSHAHHGRGAEVRIGECRESGEPVNQTDEPKVAISSRDGPMRAEARIHAGEAYDVHRDV